VTSAIVECFLIQARDREQHLGVAHSVETVNRARDDPEHALFENAILLRLFSK
jgi:hypothetical protein